MLYSQVDFNLTEVATNMKKLLTLLFTLGLAFSLGMPVFAAAMPAAQNTTQTQKKQKKHHHKKHHKKSKSSSSGTGM